MIVINKNFLEKTGTVLVRKTDGRNREYGVYLIQEKLITFDLGEFSCKLDLSVLPRGETNISLGYRILNYDESFFILVSPNGHPICGLKYRKLTPEEKYLKKHTWSKTSTLEYD